MSETFYHFTAKRFLPAIQREGLTHGRMLKSIAPLSFIDNKQWLTKNPDFNQEWAHGTGRLPYKRNEVRLTVNIPLEKLTHCKPWTQMQFLVPEVAKDLSAFGDPENWFIYQGRIPAEWITDIVEGA